MSAVLIMLAHANDVFSGTRRPSLGVECPILSLSILCIANHKNRWPRSVLYGSSHSEKVVAVPQSSKFEGLTKSGSLALPPSRHGQVWPMNTAQLNANSSRSLIGISDRLRGPHDEVVILFSIARSGPSTFSSRERWIIFRGRRRMTAAANEAKILPEPVSDRIIFSYTPPFEST